MAWRIKSVSPTCWLSSTSFSWLGGTIVGWYCGSLFPIVSTESGYVRVVRAKWDLIRYHYEAMDVQEIWARIFIERSISGEWRPINNYITVSWRRTCFHAHLRCGSCNLQETPMSDVRRLGYETVKADGRTNTFESTPLGLSSLIAQLDPLGGIIIIL